MKEDKLPTLQKMIALAFAVAILASFVFFAYRIYTKPSYEAHEKKKARILTISSLLALADNTAKDPDIWDKFREDKFTLIFDHMKMRDNWAIKLNFVRKETHLEILSSVRSGWNSRSPQRAEERALILPDGSINFDNSLAASEALEIESAAQEASGRRLSLRFTEELEPLPAKIAVEEWSMTDSDGDTFFMLKGRGASEQSAPAAD